MSQAPALVVVSATRGSAQAFADAPLSRSLARMGQCTPLALRLFADNRRPLGECYNEAIDEAPAGSVLVFVHDDVYIDDWMAGARVLEGLQRFDLLGVAGNARRQTGQVTWYMPPGQWRDGQWTVSGFDHPHLRGAIFHGQPGQGEPSNYGPAPAPVQLIDGVFMAARTDVLRQHRLRFDPALGFHFYDLDFCRSAEAAGLRLGVWPLAITHQSSGQSVQSPAWERSCRLYLQKHGELALFTGSNG